MNPSNLSEIYGAMLFLPLILIIFFFLPLFALLKRILKFSNPTPKIKNSIYTGYFMIVLLLFLDVIVAPLKFQQLCRDLAGFHGEPFPKGEGLLLLDEAFFACSSGCREYLRTGVVEFVEEELKNPIDDRYYRMDLKLGANIGPGKYRYFINHADDPICDGYYTFRPEKHEANSSYMQYKNYCLTWEKIDEFTANYTFKFSSKFLTSTFFTPIKKIGFRIENLQKKEVVGEYNEFSITGGFLEKAISKILPLELGSYARCDLPSEGFGKLFQGWE